MPRTVSATAVANFVLSSSNALRLTVRPDLTRGLAAVDVARDPVQRGTCAAPESALRFLLVRVRALKIDVDP